MNLESQSLGGVIITIKDITYHKRYDCDCYKDGICESISALSLEPVPNVLFCTEIILNAKNRNDSGWEIKSRDWELIDSDGYAYRATNMCEIPRGTRPFRILEPDFSEPVSGKTKVDFALTFPELEKDKEVVAIKYIDTNNSVTFVVSELYDELQKGFEHESDFIEDVERSGSWKEEGDERQYIDRLLDDLDLKMYSRVHNTLTPSAIVTLENAIREQIFRIKSEIKYIPANEINRHKEQLSNIEQQYEKSISEMNAIDADRRQMLSTVEELRELTPREFEEYTADLLLVLGHKRITLTPSTGDEGIDVLSEYNGKKIAVQCKKHRGMIGSPDIQKFVGAMAHAEVDSGMFITTGIFSIHAEKFASRHPIDLIDKIGLAELIEEAKNK